MLPNNDIVMLYVPCGSEEEATTIITALLNEKLAACGNVLPSQSFYIYNGEMVSEPELILVCKTSRERASQAQERILQLHSYEIPCVITLETASVNPAYAGWLYAQLSEAQESELAATGSSVAREVAG